MNGPTIKTKLFIFFTLAVFLFYPIGMIGNNQIIVNAWENTVVNPPKANKINQNGGNSDEYVESFSNFWADRYESDQLNGTYSRWDSLVSNGLYTFDKYEDTSTFDNSNNASIVDSTFENVLKCASFENASNQYCDSGDLDFDVISPGGEFLTGWTYRKQITVTGSTDGALTNYRLDFLLHAGNGSDSDYEIYLNNTANSDFSDIRFTDDTGSESGLLSYSLYQKADSNFTRVIVQVPSLPASPTETVIYIYYGNSGASDLSDHSIFDFYDDFETTTYISDTNYWELISSGAGSTTRGYYSGSYQMLLDVTNSASDNYAGMRFNNSALQHVSGSSWKAGYDVTTYEVTDSCSRIEAGKFTFQSGGTPGGAGYWINVGTVGFMWCSGIPFRDYQGTDHYEVNVPPMPDFETEGEVNLIQFDVSVTSNARPDAWRNDTFLDGVGWFAESTYWGDELWNWEFYTASYASGGGYMRTDLLIDNVYIFNQTANQPSISTGSSTIGLNYVGYINNSIEFIGGINKFFPGVNITEIATLDSLSATIPDFEYFNFTMGIDNSYLESGDALEFFLYTYNSSEVLDNTTLSGWSATQIQEFWNDTSQPLTGQSIIYIKDTNFTETNGVYSFDLLDLADSWFENRLSNNWVLGIGIQLYQLNQATGYNITQPNSNFVYMSGYFAFDYQLQVDYSDIAYSSLDLNVEPKEELITTTAFVYEQSDNTNFTNANYFEYSVAIETFSGGSLARTHFVKFYVEDPSGEVFVKWRTISGGTASYSTGVHLQDDKAYRFTFQISKSDGRILFSILDANGDQELRPTTWQSYVTSESTSRPSFFSEDTLLKYYDLNSSTGDHRRGYSIQYKVGSSKVVTGDMKISLDQIYSSAGLLDTRWYCKPESNIPLYSCEDYSSNDFDDVNSYNAHWYNLSTNTRVTYQNYIRDFRSFRGISGVNTSDTFSSDQYLSELDIYIEAYPIWEDGTVDTNEFVSVSLHLSNYTGGYNLLGTITDNVTLPFWFPDLPAGKLAVNFAYGFYWVDERTLGLTVKYYDTGVSTTNPVTLITYGNYDDTVTQDVLLVIQYQLIGGNNYNTDGGNMYIREDEIRRGRSLPFEIPSIPNPDVPYIPPNLWDQFVSGIGGFTDQLLSGDLFGALGGAFESFINAILGIGGLIVGAIFAYIVPWFQTILYAILDWALDSFGWRDMFTTAQGFILYIIDNLVLLWLFIWALCISGPFIYATFGSREEAPARILEGFYKIGWFDAKFNILNAVLPRIPLILVAVFGTIYYATVYSELSFVLDWFPFVS